MTETIGFCQNEECTSQVTEKVGIYSKEHFDGAIFCYECQKKIRDKNPTPKTTTHNTSKGWEDDIVNFETLLAHAHEKFKSLTIETELIDKDMKQKWAVVKARVTIREIGNSTVHNMMYEAHGDATQENCSSSMIAPHFLRMAETRAIARALRWATNNAKTAEEEKNE